MAPEPSTPALDRFRGLVLDVQRRRGKSIDHVSRQGALALDRGPKGGDTMIKLVYCITRRPDLSPEEFSRYWEHVHGPIGRRIPGLRRLVQSHAVPHPDGFPVADFDGAAELWFDDMAAVEAARGSPEWRASTEDEANFVDPSRCAFFLTVEREIPAGAGG